MENKNTQKNILPFWKGAIYPFQNISNHLMNFLKLTLLFALITTIISFATGRVYVCAFDFELVFCSKSTIVATTSIILCIICTALYINRWNALSTQSISLKQTFTKQYFKKDLRALCIIIVNILSLALLGISAYLLHQREATPNFALELGLFILFSLLIVLSSAIFVNNVLLLRFLNSKNYLELNKTLYPIFDNIYKYLFWFIIFFIFFAILLKNLFFYILSSGESVIDTIIGEFLVNFTLYTMASFWISNLQYQEKYLFKEES